jgi:hypothetical protein
MFASDPDGTYLYSSRPPLLQRLDTLGNGVMAARDALDVEVGVRVPVPQFFLSTKARRQRV